MQAVELLEIVDDLQGATCQRRIVRIVEDAVLMLQRHPGHRTTRRQDRHAVEDVIQHLELETAAEQFDYNRHPRLAHAIPSTVPRTGAARGISDGKTSSRERGCRYVYI